jgi:hypothetical protein
MAMTLLVVIAISLVVGFELGYRFGHRVTSTVETKLRNFEGLLQTMRADLWIAARKAEGAALKLASDVKKDL